MRRATSALALLACALSLAACGALGRTTSSTVWLGLDPPPPSETLAPAGSSLVVSRFSTSVPFQTARIATLTGPSRWDFSNYHRWIAEPGEMMAYHAQQYLLKTGLFEAVLSAPGHFYAEYRLGGAVQALYWDYERQEAVVEAEFSLARYPDVFEGFWVFRARRPLQEKGVEAFVLAASLALSDVFQELARSVAVSVSKAPRPEVGPRR